ncbi:hypothetical protein SpCBS45565_g03227 [Spizellomyces sp. 'palustris']|nr:hypothetical protein SpCBS45565_g03227 [Spizellomyces sp. 'palustris']
MSHETLDTVLNLVAGSEHYPTAERAYHLLQDTLAADKDNKHDAVKLGAVDSLLSYLVRWTIGAKKEVRDPIQALRTLQRISPHDLEDNQLVQMVDCFVAWLSSSTESDLLMILPYLKERISEVHFADVFMERHEFFPFLRLIDPYTTKIRTNSITIEILSLIQSQTNNDKSRFRFQRNGGMNVILRLLQKHPEDVVMSAILQALVQLVTSPDLAQIFEEGGGLRILLKILNQNKTAFLLPAVTAIRKVILSKHHGTSDARKQVVTRLAQLRKKLKPETERDSSITGEIVAEINLIVNSFKEGPKVSLESQRALQLPPSQPVLDEEDPDITEEPAISVRTPTPFIEFEPIGDVQEEAIKKLIDMLSSTEFHLRAEAVGIIRRITAFKELPDSLCEALTQALLHLLDDEGNFLSANEALAGICSHQPLSSNLRHRPIMRRSRLLLRLGSALSSYNVTALEQILRALKPFVSEELCSSTVLQSLRVLVHSSSSYGALARFAYNKLIEFGGAEVKLASDIIIHHDPWEVVAQEWHIEDIGPVCGHKLRPRKKKIKKNIDR